MKLFCIFSFLSLCCSVNGLVMEGIRLAKDKTHVKLQDNEPTLLECQYTLKEGQATKSVTWYHDNKLIFAWMSSDPFRLGANLTSGDIATGRTDGQLEILKTNMTFAGNYRCEVTTSAGETFKSYDYQLLVVDMPNVPISTSVEVEGCSVLVSMTAPAITPKPRPICGAYISEHQYILSAINWLGTPHYNGSVAYALDKEKLKISQLPTDAVIKCEIGITKIDGSYVQLMSKSYNITEIWERGCSPLEIDEKKVVNFQNMRYTCRNEVVPKKGSSALVKAHIKCKEPLQAKYKYLVNEVVLECKGTNWEVGGRMTWNHHDNLICVEPDEIMEQANPKIPTIKPPVAVRGHDGSNSGTTLSSSLAIIAMISVLILLGITVRLNFKKPRRYID